MLPPRTWPPAPPASSMDVPVAWFLGLVGDPQVQALRHLQPQPHTHATRQPSRRTTLVRTGRTPQRMATPPGRVHTPQVNKKTVASSHTGDRTPYAAA